MIWLAAQLVLVAYLPGALVYRLPVAARERRARLSAEERAFWAVVISAAWSSVVVLALAAASRYTFARLLWANAGLAGCAVLLWRGRLLYHGTAARLSLTAAIPAALVALGLVLFFPVSEFIIGGKDPGVYLNEGLAIGQRGSLLIHDPLVASVPAAARDLFFPSYHDRSYYSLRFMGFFITNLAKGTVVPQFPQLYPAWIAIGYGLDGLNGALRAVAPWAILGLLAVYFAGARLLGRLAAFAAAVLLGVSLIEVWFARYPNSEITVQALWFAGLLAFSRAHVDDDPFFAPVAGTLLGLMVFARFDAILAWAGVGLAAAFLFVRGRRPAASFVWPLAAFLGVAAVYAATWLRPGAERYVVFFENLRPLHLGLLGMAGLGFAALVLVARRSRTARVVTTWAPPATALLVVVAVVYAAFFRKPSGPLAPHDAYALRTFTWYFPWAGLVASVAGFVLLSWKRFWRDPLFLLGAAVYGFFVFYKIQIVPEHFWMTRRFLPVILPSACLLLAAAAFAGVWTRGEGDRRSPEGGGRDRGPGALARSARLVVPVAFVVVIGWLLARSSEPVRHHVEYQGLIPRIEQLAKRFGDDDLVLVEGRGSRSDLHVIALPLAYIYARNVLVINSPRPNRAAFSHFLLWARTRYRYVYFVGSGGTDLALRSVAVVPVATERFQVPEYESVRNAYPTGARWKEFDFSVYRFVDPPEHPAPFSLDVGSYDDLYVVRFNAKERLRDQSFRWTGGVSYLSIPGLNPSARTLTVWMGDGGRPASAGPATVSFTLDDRPLGTVVVTDGFRPYVFSIPSEVASAAADRDEPALLRIVSATWIPRDALGVDDGRKLGVMVDRVEVR
jgi:hypothetical protein